MAHPNSRETLKDYCLRELGFPVVDINVDSDQLEDRLDDAIEYWQEYHFDATDKVYIAHQITSTDITNKFLTIDDSVIRVTNILPIGSGGSNSGNIFDFEYQYRLNDMQNMTGGLSNYVIMRTNLEMMDQILNGRIPIRYSRHSDKLYLDWDWSVDVVIGNYVIIEAYITVDPNTYTHVYNDMMLKQLCTALFKKQWGSNLIKYNGIALPGGITVNADRVFADGTADVEATKKEIRDSYSEPPRFFLY